MHTLSKELNDDLTKMNKSIVLRKINFNQDFNKQAQKTIFYYENEND